MLNVPNVSNKSKKSSLKDIEVLVDSEEQNWFKWTYVGKFLSLKHIDTLMEGLKKCEMSARNDIKTAPYGTEGWPGPKYHKNKTDKCLSVFGVMYAIIKSKKPKGKAFKKHILKDIVSRRFDARIEEIQEKHQRAIEDKDAALALLNDDLQNRKYKNVALQAQRDVYKDQLQKCQDIITHLKTRYVPYAKDTSKDNIIMIIEKNTAPEGDEFYEYPYYITKIQRRFVSTKRRWFKAQYPHHRFIMEGRDNANGIHVFNRSEEEVYIERFQCHFRLVDYLCDALYALAKPAIQV